MTNSVSTGNVTGLRADSGPAELDLGASTLTNNGTNLIMATGGVVATFGDNHVRDNLVENVFGAGISLQ